MRIQRPGPFDTDFKALRSAIAYEERSFTRELVYDPASGRVLRRPSDKEPDYFGEPNESIDAAWEDLLGGKCSILIKQPLLTLVF